MSRLSVTDLSKSYGEKRALQGIGFSVEAGEIYGLVGPNGAGKTTAIKIMVGLLHADAGRVTLGGREVLPGNDVCHRIGYFADEPFVYEKLTAREILRLIGRLQALDAEVIERRIARYAGLFELEGQLDHLTETYSRGNRRKVGLITALLGDHDFYAMDEPTESLDPVIVARLKELLRELAGSGRALLISSHNLAFAESICTRIGMLHEGNLLFSGDLDTARRQLGSRAPDLESLFLEAVRRG